MDLTLTANMGRLLTLIGIALAGCESSDRRLADFAQRTSEQQARQNERLAIQSETASRQAQEVTAADGQLIQQDAVARRELLQAQNRIQVYSQREQADLQRQRQQLDAERKAASIAA